MFGTKKELERWENGKISDKEKLMAAYALNLCTVSVSQIVDYSDLVILEQEYEAILNNLNLENFPKDEALLDILKQILDTVTFFRIQEGDKKFIDREYQQKMKNAIWSAVPNFGVIIAGGMGNPWAMGAALASQVGIGYMNYRKEKANNQLEYEKQKWQLQRSAIEQFNALRRASSSISFVIPPGRHMTIESSLLSLITVDSTPKSASEPHRIASTLPVRSFKTCAAVVGLGFPERLAEGAAIGFPDNSIICCAVLCIGTRTAILSSPAVTESGITSFLGRITVNGPGMNFSAKVLYNGLVKAYFDASELDDKCTINGLSCGLPFASNILRHASAFVASAPKPYTVSVGNATNPPFFIISAAFFISAMFSSLSISVFSIAILLLCFTL